MGCAPTGRCGHTCLAAGHAAKSGRTATSICWQRSIRLSRSSSAWTWLMHCHAGVDDESTCSPPSIPHSRPSLSPRWFDCPYDEIRPTTSRIDPGVVGPDRPLSTIEQGRIPRPADGSGCGAHAVARNGWEPGEHSPTSMWMPSIRWRTIPGTNLSACATSSRTATRSLISTRFGRSSPRNCRDFRNPLRRRPKRCHTRSVKVAPSRRRESITGVPRTQGLVAASCSRRSLIQIRTSVDGPTPFARARRASSARSAPSSRMVSRSASSPPMVTSTGSSSSEKSAVSWVSQNSASSSMFLNEGMRP